MRVANAKEEEEKVELVAVMKTTIYLITDYG